MHPWPENNHETIIIAMRTNYNQEEFHSLTWLQLCTSSALWHPVTMFLRWWSKKNWCVAATTLRHLFIATWYDIFLLFQYMAMSFAVEWHMGSTKKTKRAKIISIIYGQGILLALWAFFFCSTINQIMKWWQLSSTFLCWS